MKHSMNCNELIDNTVRPYEGIPPKVLEELADYLLDMVNLGGLFEEQWGAELSLQGREGLTGFRQATNTIKKTIKKLETQSWN